MTELPGPDESQAEPVPDESVISYATEVAHAGEEAARETAADGRSDLSARLRLLVERLWEAIRAAAAAAVNENARQLRATADNVVKEFASSLAQQTLDVAGVPRN